MTKTEFLDVIKEATALDIRKEGSRFGSIAKAYIVSKKYKELSYKEFYKEMERKLEELPWEMVVSNPCNPLEEEYPTEDGKYITMLDCNECGVLVNSFIRNTWSVYHKSHIKYWIKLEKL